MTNWPFYLKCVRPDVSVVTSISKSEDTTEKIICHCNLIQFSPEHVACNAKKSRCFNLFYFRNCWSLNFSPTVSCCQICANLGVRGERFGDLKKNEPSNKYYFTTILLSLLTIKYQLSPFHICIQDPLLTDVCLLQGTLQIFD